MSQQANILAVIVPRSINNLMCMSAKPTIIFPTTIMTWMRYSLQDWNKNIRLVHDHSSLRGLCYNIGACYRYTLYPFDPCDVLRRFSVLANANTSLPYPCFWSFGTFTHFRIPLSIARNILIISSSRILRAYICEVESYGNSLDRGVTFIMCLSCSLHFPHRKISWQLAMNCDCLQLRGLEALNSVLVFAQGLQCQLYGHNVILPMTTLDPVA